MNWLEVIRAGRLAERETEPQDRTVPKVDVFERDVGKDSGLGGLEAAALSAILKTSSTQLNILSMGSAPPVVAACHSMRENLVNVFEQTELTLRNSGSFSALFELAREASIKVQEAQWLEQVAAKNKETLASLHSKLQGNQKTKQKELHKKQEAIASLKDHIQDMISKRDVALSYMDKFLSAKKEETGLRSEMTVDELRNQLEKLNIQVSNESAVHRSFIEFLDCCILDLSEQMEKWQNFYDDEMIRRNDKLKMMKEKITEEKTRLKSLNELYEEHQREINEYLEYKEQKRKEAEHDQFLYDMATKIQAWWRGTMVRKGLGPYKKRKKPAKDKKKKK